MMSILIQFIYALFATCGFCIIFRVPLKQMPVCMLVGALSWSCYQVCMYAGATPAISCFLASCFVGLLSDVCARLRREAATLFIIPGIICLVPGYNIYYTMSSMLNHEVKQAADLGTQTLMLAGAIAAGLLIMGALVSASRSIFKKTMSIKERF